MSNPELVMRLVQTALALYGASYLLSAFGLPLFYLRHFSLSDLHDRKASKWRLWPQGLLTALAVGVLVYSAAYALIAAIPYDWGSHDEDGEWQSTRDSVRFVITFVGSLYLTFSMDGVARALAVEKFARALVERELPESEVVRAARRFHYDLSRKFYSRRHWMSADQEEFPRAMLRALEDIVDAHGGNKTHDSP